MNDQITVRLSTIDADPARARIMLDYLHRLCELRKKLDGLGIDVLNIEAASPAKRRRAALLVRELEEARNFLVGMISAQLPLETAFQQDRRRRRVHSAK